MCDISAFDLVCVFVLSRFRTGRLLAEPLPLVSEHYNSNVVVLGRDRLLFHRDSLTAPAVRARTAASLSFQRVLFQSASSRIY